LAVCLAPRPPHLRGPRVGTLRLKRRRLQLRLAGQPPQLLLHAVDEEILLPLGLLGCLHRALCGICLPLGCRQLSSHPLVVPLYVQQRLCQAVQLPLQPLHTALLLCSGRLLARHLSAQRGQRAVRLDALPRHRRMLIPRPLKS
jgi:hypothetical protein